MKVLSVVGARPQFVKASPVSGALRRSHEEVLVHTGQHYDRELSAVFFEELDVPRPDYNLGVGSGSHATQTARMMQGLDEVVAEERPDAVLVYGDTNSTLAAALVAAKEGVVLAHVEAGLRSGDWSMPEEVNRVLTDHAADLLFAPSQRAADTLAAEGLTEGVSVTGDVMYDAILRVTSGADDHTDVRATLGVDGSEYVLATVHRAANTDCEDRLTSIIEGLARVPDPVVFPAHPRTLESLDRYGLRARAEASLRLVEPVGYLAFVDLLRGASRVATDSGGVQKEAFYLDTPCVTLRRTTEWTETVDCGWNVLVGADPDRIVEAVARPPPTGEKPSLYGDGRAAARVVEGLERG